MAAPRPAILILLPDGDPRADAIEQAFLRHAGPFGFPWRLLRLDPGRLNPEILSSAVAMVTLPPWDSVPASVEIWSETTAFERQAAALLARLSSPAPSDFRPQPAENKRKFARVGRETAGRRGKGVVTIFDTGLDETALKDLAGILKSRCGSGGTVKAGRIEIQGDHRDRVIAELEKLGFQTKRVGG